MNEDTTSFDSLKSAHVPVMVAEMLACLQPQRGGVYADLTYGRGGYSAAIYNISQVPLFASDRDLDAVNYGRNDPNVQMHHAKFSDLNSGFFPELLDGVVVDLGVCSTQVDQANRGFSFSKDGPLDMRMGLCQQSALELIQAASAQDLQDILQYYGEERRAKTIAQAIFEAKHHLRSTADLAELVAKITKRRCKNHPATQTFQALRIAVNSELEELVDLLRRVCTWMKKDAMTVITTFHSIEDRIVKREFRKWDAHGKVLVSKAESECNPRARSAKIRWGKNG